MKQVTTMLKTIVTSLAVVAAVALPAGAVSPQQTLCQGSGGTWTGTKCETDASQPQVVTTFRTISNLLLFILGAIAVVMVIVGGIRYATSNGEQAQVTSAKNTIMYAIIGLVVAFIAYAIVNFVTSQITKGNTSYNPENSQKHVATRLMDRRQI
jgi:uncharacterized membrane protein YjgN (DUF898 family)